MNIFFDHQAFSLLTYGGIPRYYAELISGINRTTDHSAYLPLLTSNNVHLREVGIQIRSFFPETEFSRKAYLIYKANELYSIQKLKKKSFDIFHATYYNPYFLPYLSKKPFVVTFLDMIHERFGNQYNRLSQNGVITEQKRKLAHRADRIIAISKSTKNDIVELLDVDPSKIDVIYLGSSIQIYSNNILGEQPEASPYLLFVGNRGLYKNFSPMIEAIQPLLKQYNIKLLCAGGGSFTKEEITHIQSLRLADQIKQIPVDNSILTGLYRNALAFIYPSLYEGFGIPVLEAFACGCPCIVSNVSSLPEVAGEAALYCDPASSDSMRHAVQTIIEDTALRKTLIPKGYIQLAKFSWNRTIAETINLYHHIL